MSWEYLKHRKSRSRFESLSTIALLLVLVGFVLATTVPLFQQERNGGRNELRYRAKGMGLASHNFHSTFKQLPPLLPDDATDSNVEERISVFTSLLPFLEHPRLYERVDKGVVWTHRANRDVYGTRVETFEWPEEQRPYYENEKTVDGYAIVHFSPNLRIISTPGEPMRMEDITDGPGKTILLGTIDDARVPAWGDPMNMRDPASGFAGGPHAFGGFPEWGAVMLFADGNVDNLSKKIDPKVAKALATPNGGETVGDY